MYENKIYDLLETLTEEQRKDGLQWYFTVNEFCKNVSFIYKIEEYKVAGILAALSPNNKFDRNVLDTVNFIKTNGNCKVCTFGANKEKAKQILFNANCHNEVLTILKGNKTSAFFMNIYMPNCPENVTIDLWMNRIFDNEGKSITNKRYRDFSNIIKQYAKELNLIPQQLQALLWVAIRQESF